MKIMNAIESFSQQVFWLRLLTACLSGSLLLLSFFVIVRGSTETLVFDRSCETRLMAQASKSITQDELKIFLAKSIEARFNTEKQNLDLLSYSQSQIREREQKDLETKRIFQTIIVEKIELLQIGKAKIDTTRLISVADIRSAFRFSVDVKYEMTERSASNPYGLKLIEVKPQKEGKDEG